MIDPAEITARLAEVLPTKAALHEPEFSGNEWSYVKECLDTGWVSSVGKYVDLFEKKLADFTGATHAIATVNGTAALHTALVLAGVKPGDEVIVPTLTFVATANAVCFCGADPHFADSEEKTLGLDPVKLDSYLSGIATAGADGAYNRHTRKRIAAVVCMHTFGHPVDLDELLKVCQRFQIPLIEDAAESLGSYYKGRHTGNHGVLSVLSFNGNKTVTTGGGGAVLTNDSTLAAAAKHLTTTAKIPHKWAYEHDRIAFNYRLPNINAALGCAQLEQLLGFIKNKRTLADRYRDVFKSLAGLEFVSEPEESQSNYWLNALLLSLDNASQRDPILQATNDAGLMTRPTWTPMHELEIFSRFPRMDLTVASSLSKRLINIPSSSFLGKQYNNAA